MSRAARHALALALLGLATMLGAAPASASSAASARLAADAPAPELELAARTAVPGGGSIHRYVQRAGGLPVFGAAAVVADPAGAPAALVTDSTVNAIGAVDAGDAISRDRALRVALAATGGELRARARARLGIDPRTRRPAWEVSLPVRRPLADLLVTVDAADATVVRTHDLLWRAEAAAYLFNPTPSTTQGSYEGLSDRKDRDSDLLTALRRPLTLPRITSTRGCLRGVYVDARLGKKAKAVCRPSLDFTGVTRSNDRFEALMAYFHVDRTRAYVDGLGLSQGLRAKPQKVRANGIGADNSYFSSMTRSMTLGTGGVDDGEDADVIVHEYGHSLQDQAVHRFGQSVGAGALGEGFGDYLAAAMSALTTGGDERFDPCIFDWDGVSYTADGCGRRADKDLNREQAERRCLGAVHCLGELWSSSLYELRGALGEDPDGRSVMDRVVLESHFLLNRRSGFRDGARALLGADGLLYGGAHAAAIEAQMIARKICPASGC